MPCVAVIEIGQASVSIALFDEHLQQVAPVPAVAAYFPALVHEGVLVEQTSAIWEWLKGQLSALYRQHPFAALAITAHGGTWAALDGTGALALPVIACEHDLGEAGQRDLDGRFYARCGRLEDLQSETGTCDLPRLVNAAKMVMFAQERFPAAWTRVRHLVHYPQLWGHLLTGVMAADATCSTSHSFLFDIRRRCASTAAHALGIADKVELAFRDPWAELGRLRPELQTELGLPALPVTVGLHDRHSALLPYLITQKGRDFAVNSTGDWCIAMHRVPAVRYRADELGQRIAFTIDALGGLNKASFLLGGLEYGLYHGIIGGLDPDFDPSRVDAALSRSDRLVLPGTFPGQFPLARGGLRDGHAVVPVAELQAGRVPGWFKDPTLGHDLLNISLALQTEIALRRTDLGDQTTIFIDGSFRANPTFLAVLAALLPRHRIACTTLTRASATGAALCGQALLTGTRPADLAHLIPSDGQTTRRPSLPHLASYRATWTQAVC